ncbi:MAG: hypothetical protein ABIG39_01550 [Candidatus Micrarchaeota archaeon]
MVQKIFGLGLTGVGIVPVLVIAGIILNVLNIETALASLAIVGGIGIGLLLGLLGVLAVAKRVVG